MKRLTTPIKITLTSSLLLIILIFIFVSPIAKFLIEKYDEKYTGRQIEVRHVYINPFTGYIHLTQVKIYEEKSDSVFANIPNLIANFSLHDLFSKTYEVSELELQQPKITFIQHDSSSFNFSDIITRFGGEPKNSLKPKLHFNLCNIKISDGELHYAENKIPIRYFIKKLNIDSKGIFWNADILEAKFSFAAGIGSGEMKGDFGFNMKNKDYRLAIDVHQFDLNLLGQYLKSLTNYGSFAAFVDANFKSKGNFTDPEKSTSSGRITVNDFRFGKTTNEDYLAFKKLNVQIIKMNPKNRIYLYDSITLDLPYFKYERYDHLDNVQTIFGKGGSNLSAANTKTSEFNLVIEIAKYMQKLSKNFFTSNYKINRLAITNCNFIYNDYTLNEKFSLAFNPLTIEADSIYKTKPRVHLSLKSGIKPYGRASIKVSINPKDSSDFDLVYHLDNLPLVAFNPYLLKHTSFPLNRGTLETEGVWHVKNGVINSRNHIIIIDPSVASRSKNRGLKWLPLPFFMAFVRERGNVIDYNIPITRKIENPKFHFKDVIFDIIENMVVNPPTTSYRLDVKDTEKQIENLIALKWERRQTTLTKNQIDVIRKLSFFLKLNQKSVIHVYPVEHVEKEKEHILLFEAKKKYFLTKNHKNANNFTESDSLIVVNMSIRDSSFVTYLNKQCNNSLAFTLQSKCHCVVSTDKVDREFERVMNERKSAFMHYFIESGTDATIKIHPTLFNIPFNGLSEYTIKYTGKSPEILSRAYLKMKKLNDKIPRLQYKNDRKTQNSKQ